MYMNGSNAIAVVNKLETGFTVTFEKITKLPNGQQVVVDTVEFCSDALDVSNKIEGILENSDTIEQAKYGNFPKCTGQKACGKKSSRATAGSRR